MQCNRFGVAMLIAGLSCAGVATAVAAYDASPRLAAVMVNNDPVTGDWDAVLSSDMMPEDQEILISLELDGDTVTGGFTAEGETAPFEGDWDADSATVTGVVSDPDQGMEFDVEMTIDGDEMTGTVTIDLPEVTVVIDLFATRA